MLTQVSYRIKGGETTPGDRRWPDPMEHYIVWIHIVFFSTWLGANTFCLAIFLPASRSLPPDALWQARSRTSRGLNTITAVSAPLVLVSGMTSFLLPGIASSTGLEWGSSSIIGSKLVLTAIMTINHWRQAFRYAPIPNHLAVQPRSVEPRDVAWQSWVRLLAINVVLGFIAFCLGFVRG